MVFKEGQVVNTGIFWRIDKERRVGPRNKGLSEKEQRIFLNEVAASEIDTEATDARVEEENFAPHALSPISTN